MLKLLFDESKLQEIVMLVGEDVLPDDQRLVLEVCRTIKVGFLQQNAFHKIDTYVPLEKQVEMLNVIDIYYERGKSAIEKNIPISVVRNPELLSKIVQMKYTIPNDDLSGIEELKFEINRFFDDLETKYQE